MSASFVRLQQEMEKRLGQVKATFIKTTALESTTLKVLKSCSNKAFTINLIGCTSKDTIGGPGRKKEAGAKKFFSAINLQITETVETENKGG